MNWRALGGSQKKSHKKKGLGVRGQDDKEAGDQGRVQVDGQACGP